jgi:hypothetical protein
LAPELRTAHTAHLDASTRSAIRVLMDGAFASRGWQLWRGPSSALTPDGIRRTPDKDGAIYVLPVSVPVDLTGELVCDWRPGSLW